jgi:DNA-binding response OmpR family regulator
VVGGLSLRCFVGGAGANPSKLVTLLSPNIHGVVGWVRLGRCYFLAMGKRILIVDDEPDFSELVQYRLGATDYEYCIATNSTDALNEAWGQPPDLILLDLLLPDLDGLSVCEIFARHPATQHVPVIMITAVATEITRFSAEVAGARHFFSKPVDFEKLRITIRNLVSEPVRNVAPEAAVENDPLRPGT